MKLQPGYLYHIKYEYFDFINDENLMINHENGRSRPTYFVIKDKDILWFIPLSSKIDKYQRIIDYKIKKFGSCKTILIRKIKNKKCVILLQNAFPTLDVFISHAHIINGKPLKVINSLESEIKKDFKFMLSMKMKGKNLFFTNVDAILSKLKK